MPLEPQGSSREAKLTLTPIRPIPAEGPSHNSGYSVPARPILDWMLEEARKKQVETIEWEQSTSTMWSSYGAPSTGG